MATTENKKKQQQMPKATFMVYRIAGNFGEHFNLAINYKTTKLNSSQ